jgi:hypothetical protein
LKDKLSVDDFKTLFRANSLTTKAVEYYIKSIGQDYLESVLKPVIDEIYDGGKPCEINPQGLPKNEKLAVNQQNLIHFCEVILTKLEQSTEVLPKALSHLFQFTRRTLLKYSPGSKDQTSYYTCVR